MEKKNYSGVFSIVFAICLLLLLLWKIGTLNFASGVISKIFSTPRASGVFQLSQNKDMDLVKLSNDLNLVKLEKDNMALRGQFASSNPPPSNLLPAKIIGAPTFIPTVTLPDFFIIDKGTSDGIRVGDGVVSQNNLVGKITQANSFSSKVTLVVSQSVSFTGKLESGTVGVVKGVGNGLEFDNILLSENLSKGMLVLTKGDQDISGLGTPPDLIVGKIVSIDRDPSALFQRAQVESLVDFTKINMVFVVIR